MHWMKHFEIARSIFSVGHCDGVWAVILELDGWGVGCCLDIDEYACYICGTRLVQV